MKNLLRYIFTAPYKTKCKDWGDYCALKKSVNDMKRAMDFNLAGITCELINFPNSAKRMGVHVISNYCYNSLGFIPPESAEHRHCIINVYTMDEKTHKKLTEGAPVTCPNFAHHKQCENKNCWSNYANNYYVTYHNKYIEQERQLHNFWQGRMATKKEKTK